MRRSTCSLGHRIEAEDEEELLRRVREHVREQHWVGLSRDRVLRQIREGEYAPAGKSFVDAGSRRSMRDLYLCTPSVGQVMSEFITYAVVQIGTV